MRMMLDFVLGLAIFKLMHLLRFCIIACDDPEGVGVGTEGLHPLKNHNKSIGFHSNFGPDPL